MKTLICFNEKIKVYLPHAGFKIASALFFMACTFLSFGNAQAQQNSAKSPWEDAYSAPSFADGVIRESYCDLVSLVEGTFGGLLFAAAGLMAFGFAAFGDSKHGSSAAIVAGAAFTMSAGVSLYFGDLGCGAGGAGARTKIAEAVISDVQFESIYQDPELADDEESLF